jgi:hypothetical protein
MTDFAKGKVLAGSLLIAVPLLDMLLRSGDAGALHVLFGVSGAVLMALAVLRKET